jgi:hypothetical protein
MQRVTFFVSSTTASAERGRSRHGRFNAEFLIEAGYQNRGPSMTYKGYEATVELDEEVVVFHGEVVNTRDVIIFRGSSVDELKRAFEDSVEDYLDFCASRREAPEKPFSG